MVSLGLEPGAAKWKAKTNPLSYGDTQLTYKWFKARSDGLRKTQYDRDCVLPCVKFRPTLLCFMQA